MPAYVEYTWNSTTAVGSYGRYLLLWSKHRKPTNTQLHKKLRCCSDINVSVFFFLFQISNSSCDVTSSERLLFIKSRDGYEWMTYPAGSGYVETLQCMLIDTWYIFIAFNVHFNMWYFLDTWFEICSIRTCQLPQGISDHRKANVLAVLECACEIFQVKNLDKATAENIASWCFIIKEAFTGFSSNNTSIFPFIMPVAMEISIVLLVDREM